jgi:hypothetical protein
MSMNQNCLNQPEIIKLLDHILKINQRVAASVGSQYLAYLS